MSDGLNYLLLFAVGCVAGTINVIAGGGSFLTLPFLIFMGLPPVLANGTNRVGVFLQNSVAAWSFHRYRLLDWKYALWAALPAVCGAALGVWGAVLVSDEAFKKSLAFLMIVVTLWTLWDPLKKNISVVSSAAPSTTVTLGLGFFLVGVYGGFVQAGVGFPLLAVTSLAGFDLVRGNAVKVLTVLATAFVSLPIFAWQGKVDWPLGLTLAAGTILGALLGVRLIVFKGHRWVRGAVTVVVIALALKLLLD